MRRNLLAGESGSLYLFALCGISILSNVFYYAMGNVGGAFAGISVSTWVNYAVTQVAIVLVVWLFSLWRRYDLPAVAKLRPMKDPRRYLLLLPVSIAAIVAFLPVSMLFQTFFGAIGYVGGISAGQISYDNVGVFFLSLFVLGVLPALGEELAVEPLDFRGDGGVVHRGEVFVGLYAFGRKGRG